MSKEKERIRPWCVRCQTTYDRNFYMSVNEYHTSGYLPYCKRCLGEIHEELYSIYEEIEVSIHTLCRLVDLPFKKATLELAIRQIERENERDLDTPITESYKYYFSFLNNSFRSTPDIAVNFDDSDISLLAIKKTVAKSIDLDEQLKRWEEEDNEEVRKEARKLRKQFGDYSDEDLFKLKEMYDEWESGNNLNTVALRRSVTKICQLELNIQKKIASGEDASKDFNALFKLMDQTGLKPIANTGVSDERKNTIGMRIKDLEESKPAESLLLRKVYNDLDDHEKFFRNYFVAPVKKSFGIEDSDTASMDKEVEQYKVNVNELEAEEVEE